MLTTDIELTEVDSKYPYVVRDLKHGLTAAGATPEQAARRLGAAYGALVEAIVKREAAEDVPA